MSYNFMLVFVSCKTRNHPQTTHKLPKPPKNYPNHPKITRKPSKPLTNQPNYPQTSQMLDKPPTNQPIWFLTDFYLNLAGILMIVNQNYRKNRLICYSRNLFQSLSLKFWKILLFFDDVNENTSGIPSNKIGLMTSICLFLIVEYDLQSYFTMNKE